MYKKLSSEIKDLESISHKMCKKSSSEINEMESILHSGCRKLNDGTKNKINFSYYGQEVK